MTVSTASPGAGSPDRSPWSRLARVWRLDAEVFREVRSDPGSLTLSAAVVLVAGVARGIGAVPEEGALGLIVSPFVSLVCWAAGSALIWGIGTRRFGSAAGFGQVLHTLGFASAPLVLLAFGAVSSSAIASAVWWIAHAWFLLALAVANREALALSQNRAMLVLALALGLALAVSLLLSFLSISSGMIG